MANESAYQQSTATAASDVSRRANEVASQASPYVTSFSTVDTDSDGKISQTEFMSACQKGQVMASGTGTAGGTSGTGTATAPPATTSPPTTTPPATKPPAKP